MMRRPGMLAAMAVAAITVVGSTPVQAADGTAVKRAIVLTVLTNLGVQPTDALIDDLVQGIPLDALDSSLVAQVGRSLDKSLDPTQLIGLTIDGDGDGIPDENAATNAAKDDDEDEDEDEDSGETSGSNSNTGSASTGGGTTTKPPKNDDDDDDDDDDDEDSDEDEDEEDDDESGDDEDN